VENPPETVQVFEPPQIKEGGRMVSNYEATIASA
jgi:hypothetical protein